MLNAKDIITYCNQQHVIFREDKSNADTKYTRNKIRHLVIPVLKEINPSIETTLNETIERFIGLNEFVSENICRLRESMTEQKEDHIIFNISLLKAHLHNKAVLFELFKPFGLTNVQLCDLLNVINGKTGGQIYTRSHRIIKNRKELIVAHEDIDNKISCIIKNIPDFRKAPGIASARLINISEKFEIPPDPKIACLDYEKIKFPVIIRRWKEGDYFYPLGMKQKKKLSDYFIDKKYSRTDKENSFILESDGKIIWIAGDRIDNRFRITQSSKKALLLKSSV